MAILPLQTFRYGAWVFDIDRARTILDEQHRDTVPASVDVWGSAYHLSLLRPDYQGEPWCPVFGPDLSHFNVEHAMQADLGVPVILATMLFEGTPAVLLVDGVHRMYRAMAENRSTLPAHILSAEETRLIRDRDR